MFSPDQYELLDFGEGRKLERLGGVIVDRPSPAAEGFAPKHRSRWREAQLRFDRDAARWSGEPPSQWKVEHAPFSLQLRATDFGHVGLFAEQAPNWDWIAQAISVAGRPLKVLNLFAYTGGSTLAASAAGAEVVHIDAAHNVVQWARTNAELSGLTQRPIRWIAEDATRFVQRELRRGNQYDAVILDPPSYGHGPKGELWQIEQHLPPLLAMLAELTVDRRAMMLLTCHSPGYEAAALARFVRQSFGAGQIEAGELSLIVSDGSKLPSGHFARWLPKG